MLRSGFERGGLTRMLAIADAENVAPRRVLEKIGLTVEGYALDEGREQARYAIQTEDLQVVPPPTRS